MEEQEDLTLVGENGEIPAGLPGNIMRKSMENKNLLRNKGSMYIGTGEKDEDGVVITKALLKGENNTVLCVDSNNKLAYRQLTPQMFTPTTVNIEGEFSNLYEFRCKRIISFPPTGRTPETEIPITQQAGSCVCVKYAEVDETESISFMYAYDSVTYSISIVKTKLLQIKSMLSKAGISI